MSIYVRQNVSINYDMIRKMGVFSPIQHVSHCRYDPTERCRRRATLMSTLGIPEVLTGIEFISWLTARFRWTLSWVYGILRAPLVLAWLPGAGK